MCLFHRKTILVKTNVCMNQNRHDKICQSGTFYCNNVKNNLVYIKIILTHRLLTGTKKVGCGLIKVGNQDGCNMLKRDCMLVSEIEGPRSNASSGSATDHTWRNNDPASTRTRTGGDIVAAAAVAGVTVIPGATVD